MTLEEKIKKGEYSHLMEDIQGVLKKENVKFSASQSEIVVSGQTKKKICKLIGSLPIPATTLSFLLDVVETKKRVYIRKRVNV